MPQSLDDKDPKLDTVVTLVRTSKEIKSKSDRSPLQQLFDNVHMIKSPLFMIQIGVFVVANCSLTLSLNVINGLLDKATGGDREQYNQLQEKFEYMRGLVAMIIGPIIGVICDLTMLGWKRLPIKNGSTTTQTQVTSRSFSKLHHRNR